MWYLGGERQRASSCRSGEGEMLEYIGSMVTSCIIFSFLVSCLTLFILGVSLYY